MESKVKLTSLGVEADEAAAVRPRATGLLTDIECSRVRDSSWIYLTSLATTRIGIGLTAVQRKLSDCVVVFVFLAPSSYRADDPYLQTLLLRVSLSRCSENGLSCHISI